MLTEEQVFLAALDLSTADERSAYLDRICGGDAAFRRQVEALLAAHFKEGEFLDEPLGEQLKGRPRGSEIRSIPETVFVSGYTDDTDERKDRVDSNDPAHDDRHDATEAGDREQSREAPGDLRFLEPSKHDGSYGRIGHYEVLQVLGQGGFGIVLRAFDDVLHRVVALKVLAPAIAATSPARKRFLREAQASARVRHENVVQVYAVEELPIPFLVMEFIAGETLQQRLDRKGPLEAAEIVSLGRQIAEGLAAAHATGLIHRDIKPGNILIEGGASERVKITDFGLARAADDASLTQSGMVAGTPMFMAPEQIQGVILDQRADLFSLGSVLYVMTCGRPPFRAATTFAVLKRVVEEQPRPIADLIPETPPWLCDIIEKLHAKNPDQRYQSAREVADVLADCEARLKSHLPMQAFPRITRRSAAPPTVAPSAAPKLSSGAWKWTAAAVVFLAIGGLAVGEMAGVTNFFGRAAKRDNVAQDANSSSASSAEKSAEDAPTLPVSAAGNVRVEASAASETPPPDPDRAFREAALQALRRGIAEKVSFRQQIRKEQETGQKTLLDLLYSEIELCEARIHLEQSQGDAVAAIALLRRLSRLRERERNLIEQQVKAGAVAAGILEQADSSLVDARGRLRMAIAESPAAATFSKSDIERIGALPADDQVEAVRAELQRRNPEFDGTLQPTIEDGVVVKLSLNTDEVEDISPVRSLSGLRNLDCRGTYRDRGKLADLSPLVGLSLREIDCSSTQVADLSPLADMPLVNLQCNHNPVTDLSPVEKMPLLVLGIAETQVSDLSPLKGKKLNTLGAQLLPVTDLSPLAGMPLTGIDLYHTVGVTSLEPLRGMPLEAINIQDVPISDLSPLSGMMTLRSLNILHNKITDLSPLAGLKLTTLLIYDKQVTDLSPIAGMPLVRLEIFGSGISDLAPLTGMPLQEFRFDPQAIDKGIDVLRGIQTLQTIGVGANEAWPPAEFWARYDRGEFKE